MCRKMFTIAIVMGFAMTGSLMMAQTAAKPSQPAGQAAVKKNPLVPYAGNWLGNFEGKPWLILNLSLNGEQFSGSLRHARDIEVNDNGELKKVGEDFTDQPVTDGKLNPDGLILTVKDSESQETMRFMLKLTGDATAEIKMIGMVMPPGIAKPKPWKLTRYTGTTLPKLGN